mmetsp:Transcript_17860/g.44145  ORF Transcript_17860/g.44145 Transcript_17860/m.44145 type:complete len:95 (+) Transcript_17860:2717-3001(+)
MAVKQGGSPDPNSNRMLGDIIKQAKTNNVPVDNINRAIKRATEGNAGDFSESTFEAYGFGGASFGKGYSFVGQLLILLFLTHKKHFVSHQCAVG